MRWLGGNGVRMHCALHCVLALGLAATPALGDDITDKKAAVDQKTRLAQRPARLAPPERAGAARPDRRGHGADPHARAERRRRLAPALDARAGSRAAPQAARQAQRAVQAAVGAARRAQAPVPALGRPPRPAARLDLRVGPADDARVRVRRVLDRRRARPGRLHGPHRTRGPRDRTSGSRTRRWRWRSHASGRRRCASRSRAPRHVITARAAQVRETRGALLGARDSLAATRQDKLVVAVAR